MLGARRTAGCFAGSQTRVLTAPRRTRAITELSSASRITERGDRTFAPRAVAHQSGPIPHGRGKRHRAPRETPSEGGGTTEVCESDHESEVLDAGLRSVKLGATLDVCNAQR